MHSCINNIQNESIKCQNIASFFNIFGQLEGIKHYEILTKLILHYIIQLYISYKIYEIYKKKFLEFTMNGSSLHISSKQKPGGGT